MDDNLSILFLLEEGETSKGKREACGVTSFLRHEAIEVRIDPSREDLGVGALLDDPEVVAVHATWLDDYDDNQEPILAITRIFRVAQMGTENAQAALPLIPSAIRVPHHPTSTQIVEWIATYMRDNVYHDGMSETY
jgi:hypothetical protein